MTVVDWLLGSDPAIRWQVMRDLTGEPDDVVAAERSRVASEGWGARLLAGQAPDGQWGESTYSAWIDTPDGRATLRLDAVAGHGPRADQRGSLPRRRPGSEQHHLLRGGNPFFAGEVEPCINGRVLGLGAYFGEPCEEVLERLLGEQLTDGGWNCEAPPSATILVSHHDLRPGRAVWSTSWRRGPPSR